MKLDRAGASPGMGTDSVCCWSSVQAASSRCSGRRKALRGLIPVCRLLFLTAGRELTVEQYLSGGSAVAGNLLGQIGVAGKCAIFADALYKRYIQALPVEIG